MAKLFEPIQIGNLSLKNRVVMPPMCMYEAQDGLVNTFHEGHYLARAIGGVSLIIIEATAVSPNGRITANDLGLWDDAQVPGMKALVSKLHQLGAKVGVQLGHAGRKAEDAPDLVSVTKEAFNSNYRQPKVLDTDMIHSVVDQFGQAAKRAQACGFDMIELHGAHGYLLSTFLEKAVNTRTDSYGGSLENRYRLLKEVVAAVRSEFKKDVWVRLSASAYVDDQNSLEDWIQIAKWLKEDGVALVDVSSGGLFDIRPNMPIGQAYQAHLSKAIKEGAQIPVSAVGILQEPGMADFILRQNMADVVEIGRGLIRNPNWLMEAAKQLRQKDFEAYNDSYMRGYQL